MESHTQNSGPETRLQSDSVIFIETRLDDFHPGFANPPSHYDERVQGFVIDDLPPEPEAGSVAFQNSAQEFLRPPLLLPADVAKRLLPARTRAEPGAAMQFWNRLFQSAKDQFIAAHPVEPPEIKKKGHSIRGKRSWNDVYEELEAAKNAYCKTDSGFKGTFRKVYRKSADHGAGINLAAVKVGQNVLNNDYVTPVLGAVQLVLEAAAKAVKMRQDMVAAFDDIDRKFAEVEVYLQAFDGDENILAASTDLIVAVFYAVELVLGFFVSSMSKRALRATFTMDHYRQKIDQGLSDIQERSSCLMREVNMSRAHKDRTFQEQVLYDTTATKALGAQMYRMMHCGRNEMKGLLDGLVHKIQDLEAKVESRLPSPIPPTHLYTIAAAPPDMKGIEYYSGITTEDVLDWIDIPNVAEEDLELIATHSHVDVSDAEQGRAEQLIMNMQLQGWLSTSASSQLLIHGNYDDVRRLSGLSLLCASMALNLDQRNDTRLVRLLFFCGLHNDSNLGDHGSDDPFVPLIGGRAIIASFICQLLGTYNFGPELPFPCLGESHVQEGVHHGDVDMLCFLFDHLVRRLPSGVVLFCIIDGAVFYERPAFVDDAYEVLEQLLQLSRDESVRAAVKVLVTSPTRTTAFRQLFGQQLVLSMDAVADAQWEASRARTKRLLDEPGPEQ